MRVLVLGGGGREHALCWRLARDRDVQEVLCAPGNPGTAAVARNLPVDPTDPGAVRQAARDELADLVVVGPEAPLVAGVADAVAAVGVPVFGPVRDAARIEGSKAFAKDVMRAAGVPTAAHWSGGSVEQAHHALDRFEPPYVVKADGLAAGKGVRICPDRAAAERALHELLVQRALGAAGQTVVVEEFLHGSELSVFALCDGDDALLLPPARDYKRAFDGDAGPNTGGMGAVSPVPVDEQLVGELRDHVFRPVLSELAGRGLRYRGVLYAGLVLTPSGPQVLEFNARFGDPETQVVLPRLGGDLAALLLSCAQGRLESSAAPPVAAHAAVTVVLAAGGYPAAYRTGQPIRGLDDAAAVTGALVFHAGTRRSGADVVTAGGRVLAVTGTGADVSEARMVAYAAAERIAFEGLQRRSDIALGLNG